MAGNNLGKKYIKLKGGETAAPQNEARAREFMKWYADNAGPLHAANTVYDYDTATDAALRVYEAIALRGAEVSNFKSYYLRAYHNELIANALRSNRTSTFFLPRIPIGERARVADREDDRAAALEYEEEIERLRADMIRYVRDAYSGEAAFLFEIYMSLYPSITYKTLARTFGIADSKVWPVLVAVRKDIAIRFKDRRNYILSLS